MSTKLNAKKAQRESMLMKGVALGALALSLPSVTLSQALLSAQPPPVEDAEVVVVTGYRSSLATNLRAKRLSVSVRDTIVAEDIGQFPDSNLSESIQRIPGVALQRTARTDEGAQVVVRGLPADFTQVTLNGVGVRLVQAGIGLDSSRSFNFQVFASELFSRVDIYKSPEARLEEGGIAATVDLQTPRPLRAKDGWSLAYNVAAQYRPNSEDVGPRMSALASGNFGKIGIIGSASYQKYTVFGNGWQPDLYSCQLCLPTEQAFNFNAPGVNLNGFTQDQVNRAFFPRLPRTNYRRTDQERLGLTGTIEYQPNDKFNLIVDGMYAKLDDPNGQFFLFDGQLRSSLTTAAGAIVPLDVRITDQNDLYGTFGNVVPRTESSYTSGETQFTHFSVRGAYELNDSLKVDAMASVSKNETNFAFNFGSVAITAGNNTTGQLVGRTLFYDPKVDPYFPTIRYNFDILNPANYINNFRVLAIRDDRVVDDVTHARVGLDWKPKVALGALIEELNVKVGMSGDNYQRSFERIDALAKVQANIASAIAGGLNTKDYLIAFPYAGNINSRVNAGFLTEFPIISSSVVDLFGTRSALANGTSLPAFNYGVEEDITAAFVQFDLSGKLGGLDYRLNTGVRFANTQTTIENFATIGGTFKKVTLTQEYSDVLPSANIAIDLTDKILVRASAAKTLTRPPLADIGSRISVSNFAAYPEPLRATGGNPSLEPTRGNQFDMGIEWYFAPEAVVSVGLFSKDLEGITASRVSQVAFSEFGSNFAQEFPNIPASTTVLLTGPVNLDKLEVKGIEVALQLPFGVMDFMPSFLTDFGVTANFTLIDESNGSPYDLQETAGVVPNRIQVPALRIPESAFNLGAYYEKGKLEARLNYSWVDKYTRALANRDVDAAGRLNQGIATNLLEVQAARGVLDGSISFKMNDRVTFTFQALNITNSITNTNFESANNVPSFGDGTYRTDQSQVFGRVFFFGVKGKF